ncbi:unnamed protein product, partial [Rotaria socialis]
MENPSSTKSKEITTVRRLILQFIFSYVIPIILICLFISFKAFHFQARGDIYIFCLTMIYMAICLLFSIAMIAWQLYIIFLFKRRNIVHRRNNKSLYSSLELLTRVITLIINVVIALNEINENMPIECLIMIGLFVIYCVDLCCYKFTKINLNTPARIVASSTDVKDSIPRVDAHDEETNVLVETSLQTMTDIVGDSSSFQLMSTEEIQVNSLSESDEESRKLYSVWSRFHPLIFIPGWIAVFVPTIFMLKGLIDFIKRTNGSTRLLGYVMFGTVLFGISLLIIRVVEYLIDMKMIYFHNNRSSNSTHKQSDQSYFLFIIKPYFHKFHHLYCCKVIYKEKQNENIFPL